MNQVSDGNLVPIFLLICFHARMQKLRNNIT